MKKILLLGGAGFIGLNLARQLSADDQVQVDICDNLFRTSGDEDDQLGEILTRPNVNFHRADLTDAASYQSLPRDYQQVYMLASIVGVDYVNSVPHEIIRINTAIIHHTLNWLQEVKPQRVLFTSSSECYAGAVESFDFAIPTPETVPLCVTDITHPRFTYAVTKMLGESGVFSYARSGFFEAVVVRYHNVYGPRMGFKHVIPHVVQRFLDGENPFTIYGHDQTRSFNFIDDAVAGTIAAMDNGQTLNAYHIGADDEITIDELVRHIGRELGMDVAYTADEAFSGSVARRCPDIQKARSELGYNPKVGWQDGVTQTVRWYHEHIASGGKQYERYDDAKGGLG